METQAKLFILLLGLSSIANFSSSAPALKKTAALEMPSYKAGEIPVMVIQDPNPPVVHVLRSRDGLGTATSTSGVKGGSAVRRTDVKNGDNVREEPRNPGGAGDHPPMQYKVRPEVPPRGTKSGSGASAGGSIKKPGKVAQAATSAVKKPQASSSSVKG